MDVKTMMMITMTTLIMMTSLIMMTESLNCNCNCNCNVEFVKRAKILLTVKTVTKALVRMFSDYLAIQICFQF